MLACVVLVSEHSTQGRPGRETLHGSGEKTPVHGCFPEGTPAGLMFDLRLGCTPLKPWDVRSSKGAWDGRECYLHFPMNASICINLVSLCMRTLPLRMHLIEGACCPCGVPHSGPELVSLKFRLFLEDL